MAVVATILCWALPQICMHYLDSIALHPFHSNSFGSASERFSFPEWKQQCCDKCFQGKLAAARDPKVNLALLAMVAAAAVVGQLPCLLLPLRPTALLSQSPAPM